MERIDAKVQRQRNIKASAVIRPANVMPPASVQDARSAKGARSGAGLWGRSAGGGVAWPLGSAVRSDMGPIWPNFVEKGAVPCVAETIGHLVNRGFWLLAAVGETLFSEP